MIVDTTVISELRKGEQADRGVQAFWKKVDPESLYIPVQTVGGIRAGVDRIAARGDKKQALMLERWLEKITSAFSQRILNFDMESAQVWGRLMAASNQHPIDKQIAAIALIHDMAVVTRNVRDFSGTGVKTINPFV